MNARIAELETAIARELEIIKKAKALKVSGLFLKESRRAIRAWKLELEKVAA